MKMEFVCRRPSMCLLPFERWSEGREARFSRKVASARRSARFRRGALLLVSPWKPERTNVRRARDRQTSTSHLLRSWNRIRLVTNQSAFSLSRSRSLLKLVRSPLVMVWQTGRNFSASPSASGLWSRDGEGKRPRIMFAVTR